MANEKKIHINRLFKILDITDKETLKNVAKVLKTSCAKLEYYNNNRLFPEGELLNNILKHLGIESLELKIKLGIIDNSIIEWICNNPNIILQNYKQQKKEVLQDYIPLSFGTEYGQLYKGDCLAIMKQIPEGSVDLIFADPPFNLGKQYQSKIDDYISEQEYINWTEEWLMECIRILTPGGSLFVYNLPYWNIYTAEILNKYLNFRHWIGISMKGLMPVQRKLHPEHYSLLYYVKGDKPKTFNKQRIPMQTCRHCGGEVRDYGGKKKDLDAQGLSISDIFTDINPVRHKKYKNREANELPLKLLHRIILLASNEGDTIFDPFGGSGTTYVTAEYLRRNWIGCEIGDIEDIVNRFNNNQTDIEILNWLDSTSNVLFTDEQIEMRRKNGFWGYEKLE